MTLIEQTKSMSKAEQAQVFETLLAKASAAGHLAAEAAVPTPMVVSDSQTDQSWFVSEGPCGFAWVRLRPATSTFARYIKATRMNLEIGFNTAGRAQVEAEGGHWSPAYQGGYEMWVWVGGQSMARKEAFARAHASVLQEAGYQAYAGSRMD